LCARHGTDEETRSAEASMLEPRLTVHASASRVPPEPHQAPIHSHAKANRELSAKFDTWLEVQHYSEHTRRAYRELTEDLCRFIASRSLLDVQHFDIREYLGYLHKRGLSASSLARQLSGLKAFFDFLQLGGLVSAVAARMIRTRKVPKRLPRVLSVDEAKRLIEAGQTPRDRAVLELLYATGCRRAELAGIRIEDVDFEARSICVTGKGDKQRIVLFGRPAQEAVLAYLGDRKDGFLFQENRSVDKTNRDLRKVRTKWLGRVSEMTCVEARAKLLKIIGPQKFCVAQAKPNKSTPTLWWRASWWGYRDANTLRRHTSNEKIDRSIGLGTINRIVKKAALRAGLKNVFPHALRHSFATHLVNGGANIRAVQELLGHSSVSTTMIYTHLALNDLSQVHTKFHPRS
jgi:integrase/recombinase XerC